MSLERWLLFFKKKISLPPKRELANRSSKTYIAYLRKKGVSIGENCEFFKPSTQFVDPSNPELITIGDNVNISLEVAIVTHGYDYSVLRVLHPGEGFGSAGPVTIGNNVFIGMRAMILKDTIIGNNCVIGAGSVVRGHIPDNSVVAGNPARIVMSIDDLYEKYKTRLVPEAQSYARMLHDKRKGKLNPLDFQEFFYLFTDVESAEKTGFEIYRNISADGPNSEHASQRPYASFEDFIKDCNLE